MPRHPVTRPALERVEKAEEALEIERLLEGILATLETETITS